MKRRDRGFCVWTDDCSLRPLPRQWRRLAVGMLLAFQATGLIAPLPAQAAEDGCIATYDRHGTVTGRYCPDGTSKPPPAGARKAARAPDAVDPEQSVPSEERGGHTSGTRTGAKSAPKGGEIMCGKWKTAGAGCRGIFTILR
jgi:hypothetical protein